MKTSAVIVALLFAFVMGSTCVRADEKATNKYVGVKACAPCHKAEKIGNQFGIWQKAKHSQAFQNLKSKTADSIAKAKGSKKPAAETAECLGCHTTQAPAAQVTSTFDMKDGVQCETCHGPGSAYKSMAIMKDHAKAVAAGATDFKDKAVTEAFCKKCHNDKSPTFKGFKFDEFHAKIKHTVPKKS